jgi:hypothetical protein
MSKKRHDQSRPNGRAPADADTSSYEQSQGAPGPNVAPNRPSERLPHERDESARATGDRLKEKPIPSDGRITQARKDVEEGLVDTDRRGVPNDLPKPRSP